MGAIGMLKRRGIDFKLRHCSNSGAILDYPDMQLDMVRPGIILVRLIAFQLYETTTEFDTCNGTENSHFYD